ncbi:MAG: hypothetical protein P8X76_10860 [Maritimibacter sp.]
MLAHHKDPVGHFDRLIKLGDKHDGGAAGGGFADLVADVAPGLNVDTLKGFIED